jgi:hypothetical protein
VCRGCARIHGGRCRKCKRCHAKLPGGARQPQFPARREQVTRTEDGYWGWITLIGKNCAEREVEKDEWKRTEVRWKRVSKRVRSLGRGRDTDAPAGGPRGPNFDLQMTDEDNDNDDHTNDDENYDNDDYDDADAAATADDYNTERDEEEMERGDGQRRKKRRRMTTHGGRIVGMKSRREEETRDEEENMGVDEGRKMRKGRRDDDVSMERGER